MCATADESLFKGFGKTIALSSWPSLNNDKDRLSLLDAQHTLIDEVGYTDNWYKDAIKKVGGYSLELIDPYNKCVGIQNWQASKDVKGGSPGTQNSVYRSQIEATSPEILSASIIDEHTVRIDFNKSIDSLSGALLSNYRLNNGTGDVSSAVPQSPDFSSVVLKLATPVHKGLEYLLTVNLISDCAGNLINPAKNTVKLFMAKAINRNDILISEVLVNPRAGGVDFIEIYNATDHVLDLATLKLANKDSKGNVTSIKSVSSKATYIPSKSYWALTSDLEMLKQHYDVKNPNQATEMAALPAYNNEMGTVILLTDSGEIDRFDYQENMHFPLLRMVKQKRYMCWQTKHV
ncbi:MAG: lamin tail domain-containing protein [Sphingobacteriales bacterium]|nr:MAG: lamin tail domain-containing protein [Sphingobacteriales bacterium]